jgi:glycosyltransferase involved in cell wall biosynthesis
LTSIADLLKSNNLFLYCVGNSFTIEEKKLIHRLELNAFVINMGILSDNELANLYHNATCFVYPSLYEGFGIPILEAFKHKCPVVLSNTSCFPEIAKGAAIYFNPNDSKSIQIAIIEAIANRQSLIELGSKRIFDFSWDKAAELTSNVYKWAIEKHKLGI